MTKHKITDAATGRVRIIAAKDGASQADIDALAVAVDPGPSLADRVAMARATGYGEIEARATALVGPYPPVERVAWPAKEAAARAYLANPSTATAAQQAMLGAEAAGRGEPLADTAARVTAKADQFLALSGALSGARAAFDASLDAAPDVAGINAAVAALRAALAAIVPPA